MTICTGCSRNFQNEQCMPCSKSPQNAKLQHEWPTCIECGTSFEFLTGDICFPCKKRAKTAAPLVDSTAPQPSLSQLPAPARTPEARTTGDDIAYAMSHPVNVRAHGSASGTSTVNPYLPQNVPLLNEDSLQYSDDVRYTIISFRQMITDFSHAHWRPFVRLIILRQAMLMQSLATHHIFWFPKLQNQNSRVNLKSLGQCPESTLLWVLYPLERSQTLTSNIFIDH